MPTLRLGANLKRHCGELPELEVAGETLRAALESAFLCHPVLRSYVLDDQGQLRRHMAIFVDDEHILDRAGLNEKLSPGSTIDIFQALSGG